MPRVHWAGAGLSTGSGLRVLADQTEVVLYGRTRTRAEAAIDRLGLTGRIGAAALDTMDPAPGDVVVSMLPSTEHPRLLARCRTAGAHFADTSYANAEIAALADGADTVVLTEAGLDPGIDHLLADELVADAKAATTGPARVEFRSYCGGIPARPNEFRYRFSWAPRGVLTALLSQARYVRDGVQIITERPWQDTEVRTVGGEEFEVYPNRDSTAFPARYGIPPDWTLATFVRGTLRHAGWRAAWTPVFDELTTGDPERITALAAELAARYPTTDTDRDRVVLDVSLTVGHPERPSWSGESVLDVVGDDQESAMARLVSTTLAVGVTDILAGRLEPGLRRGAEGLSAVRRWLAALAEHGIAATRTPVARQEAVTSA